MIDIAKKKLPAPVIGLIVYITYCAMNWFLARGVMAYAGERFSWPGWLSNDVWAFFLGGLLPLIVYSLASNVAFRTLMFKVQGDIRSISYGLNFAIIAANLVLFALKFMYLAFPLQATVINIILDPAVTIMFVGLYMFYAFKMEYVEKSSFRLVLSQVYGTLTVVYAAATLVNILFMVV